MKNKIFIAIFICSFSCHYSFAQTITNYSTDIKKMSDWVSDIDSVIARAKSKEQLKMVSYQFSDIIVGLQNITEGQKDLAAYIPKHGEVAASDTAKTNQLIIQIGNDIYQMYHHVRKISANVSDTDKVNISSILESFQRIGGSANYLKLNDLRDYLYGDGEPANGLKKDETEIKIISEDLVGKLQKAKEKIKAAIMK